MCRNLQKTDTIAALELCTHLDCPLCQMHVLHIHSVRRALPRHNIICDSFADFWYLSKLQCTKLYSRELHSPAKYHIGRMSTVRGHNRSKVPMCQPNCSLSHSMHCGRPSLDMQIPNPGCTCSVICTKRYSAESAA